jgi:hypothetical protein
MPVRGEIMLDEVFVKKAAKGAMSAYSEEHGGKKGVAKTDIIKIVMGFGGDMNDVNSVMEECVRKISPELLPALKR